MRNLIYIFLLFYFFGSNAQILTVKDKITHEPLELVIFYSQTRTPVVSNIKGKVDISSFKYTDSIYVRLVGYTPLVVSFSELEKSGFKMFMEPSNITLDEVVISANKWAQQKRDVPSKISVIRAVDITLQNPQTTADMLGVTEEVYIQKSQLGGGSPMIRGFAANRTLIVVDGARMNTAIFRGGNLQNVISLDPFSTEKAEIIFGAGSVIYGSDAIGGVMNFYTLRPRPSYNEKPLIKGNATVRYSSANYERTGHVDLRIGLKKWGFVTSASGSEYGDLRMGTNGPSEYLRNEYVKRIDNRDSVIQNSDPLVQTPTGYSQLNIMQKVRFRPNNNWDVNYGFHYSTSSDVPRYDRLIQYKNGTLRDGDWYYGPQTWMMNMFNIHYAKKNLLFDKLNSTFAYQLFEESRHNRGLGSTDLTKRTENVSAFSGNLDFEKKVTNNQELCYGIEMVFNHVGSHAEALDILTKNTQPESTRYPDGSIWNSYAAYVDYKYKLNRRISILSGIRYNWVILDAKFDTTFFPFPYTGAHINTGAVNGNVGVAYVPEESMQLNFNISTGFRAPNVDDIGKVFDSEPGTVIVPNPLLKPEYAYNAELGMAKIFNDLLKVELTGFYTLLDNAMVRRDFQLNGMDSVMYDGAMSRVQALQNASKAYVWGVQSGVEMKLLKDFGMSAHINYQKGKEELNDGSKAALRHAAPVFGSVHFTYSRNRFKADLYGNYNGEISYDDLPPSERDKPYIYAIDSNGNPYSPAWYTLNFKILCRISEYVLASAGIENITDQRYRPYSSGIVAPGRNFIISLSASL